MCLKGAEAVLLYLYSNLFLLEVNVMEKKKMLAGTDTEKHF